MKLRLGREATPELEVRRVRAVREAVGPDVRIMVDANDPDTNARVAATEQALFEGVVALEGSVTGDHGVGFRKAKYLPLEISPETIAVMKRVKQAFDPKGLLNPGKIFLE